MKKERNIGQEILTSIKEIKEWQQGKKKLKTTRVQLPRAADVAKIRQNLDLTQDEFADFMGVKVKTLQNWEQKRREPQGPARSLLRIAEKAPEAILKSLPRSIHRLSSHHHGVQKRKSSSR
jgi:putative transcriptional regulator